MKKDVPRRYLLAPPVFNLAFYPLLFAAALRAVCLRASTPDAAE